MGWWRNATTFNTCYSSCIANDTVLHVANRKIQYLPGAMWPCSVGTTLIGNLHLDQLSTPYLEAERGGNFMWNQAYAYAANNNVKTILCAKFGEVHKGTSIFKDTLRKSNLPLSGGRVVGFWCHGNNLSLDCYLCLADKVQLMLERRPLTLAQLPLLVRSHCSMYVRLTSNSRVQ